MSSVAVAGTYARRLVETEARRSSTRLKDAIPIVARRLRTSRNSVYSLIFQPPKKIDLDLYIALEDAVVGDLAREIGALEHEMSRIASGQIRRTSAEVFEVEEGLADLKARLKRRESRASLKGSAL
jgi:hypothetical protein